MIEGFTPGPWECLTPEDDGSIVIVGSNLGGIVGAAHCWPTEVDTRGSDRVRANAHLIASAPTLHAEAVKALAASTTLGAWMSVALDDPAVCDAMKQDIIAWFDAIASLSAALNMGGHDDG